jgi:hypothetical protein
VLTGAWPAAYGLGRCLDGFAVDDGNGRQCGELAPKVAKAKAAKK